MLQVASRAKSDLLDLGYEIEIINGFSVNPFDIDTIIESVKKTGRLIVVHEAHLPCGPGAEIFASIVEIDNLIFKTKPVRITPPFAPSPFAPILEREYLPSEKQIIHAVSEMMSKTKTG